jgi:hypothetical protein
MNYTGRFLLNDAGSCGSFALVPGLAGRSHTFVRKNDRYGGRSALEFNNLTKAQFDALVKDIYAFPRPRPKPITLEVDIPETAPLEAMIEGLQADLADRVTQIQRLTARVAELEKRSVPPVSAFPAIPPAPLRETEEDRAPSSEELHAAVMRVAPLKKRRAQRKRTARA